jgi:hypothetical protein
MRFHQLSSSFEKGQANSILINSLSVTYTIAGCIANDCLCFANYLGRQTVDWLRDI